MTCPPCSCYRAPLLCLRPRARAAVPAGGLDLRLRTSRSVFERFDLQAVIARLTPLSRGSPHDRDPSCVTPLPNVFDDEARRAATLLFAIRHPLPRRSLGGVQLPDGAPGGDRTLAVGGMPLSVLCSRFDCQRAPFDSSRRLAPPGTSPVAERRGLKAPSVAPSEPRAFRHGWLFAQTSARLLSSPAPFDSTRTPVFRRALLRRCRRSRTRQTISSTTHHAAPSKARAPSPPALRHPRQAVMMRNPEAQDESRLLGHDSSSPAVLVFQVPSFPGSQPLFHQVLGPRARLPLVALASHDRRSRPVVLPNSMYRERTRDGPNPSHETGQPLSPMAWRGDAAFPKEETPPCPTSRVTLPGGPAQMIHAKPPTWRPLAPWIDPRIATPNTSLSPRRDITTRKQWPRRRCGNRGLPYRGADWVGRPDSRQTATRARSAGPARTG